MILTEKEYPYKKMGKWEEFIKPSRPEQPAIRIFERREAKDYEALFALELEGVIRNSDQAGAQEDQESDSERFKTALFSSLSDNQRLDFVYSGERSVDGRECFNWRIIGYSSGSTPESAFHSAKQFWQSLSVIMGNVEKEYRFKPVNEPGKLIETNDETWVKGIMPAGVAISGIARRRMGFESKDEFDRQSNSIIVPIAQDKAANNLDSVVIGVTRCPAPVKLILSINPFTLSAEDLQKIGTALEWLQRGEQKRIKYYGIDDGVEDIKLLNGLKRNLTAWIKNPSGFRVTCKAMSEMPIPVSFLKMVGNEVFHGSQISDTLSKELDNALDLRNCINANSSLPPLFPKSTTLMDKGIKRTYRQQPISLPEKGIILGRIGNTDVRFASADRSRHCYIVGATGTGKSTLLYNMIVQDIENGKGVAVIDPHGDLYHQLLSSIPKSRMDDVVLIDPCDFEYAVGINFLECDSRYKQVQMNFVVNEMIKIFDRLYDLRQTGGPLFEQYMRNALLLILDNDVCEPTLMDIPMIFEDKGFRSFLLDKCKNSIVESFWRKQAEEAGGDASLRNLAPYITSKLNQFISNALLRPIIGQHRSTINFREIMDSGKILLVNLSKGVLGELDTQLLGMLIIGKIFTAAMRRVAQKTENRRPLFLYVDEFQNFTTDTVAYLLSEARKFGLYLTLANQNLSQLSANSGRQSILDAVLGNVGTTLIFRLGAVDSEKMQIYTKPEFDAQDLQNLPDFHTAGRLLVKNCPSRPFVLRTLPYMKINNYADAESIIEASRGKYALPTEQVEQEIILRRESYKFNTGPNSSDED
ncbi:MAG: ATP-binding protein [Nitrospirae bacterium]|nr:ATP-binding protein [Nitrospirota bacterium]